MKNPKAHASFFAYEFLRNQRFDPDADLYNKMEIREIQIAWAQILDRLEADAKPAVPVVAARSKYRI